MWDDYAALKAETVKRLEETIPPVEAYIIKLEAENERLRKAGDDMAWALMGNPTVEAWNAAKGVQP
jgi:phosphoribosylformylglycinamidine (FGAM) synthase PurS component